MEFKSSSLAAATRSTKGFTLIEVLVAMTLFFLAVTYFSMAYLNTLMAMEKTRINQGFEQDMASIRREVLMISDLEELEEGGQLVTGEHGLARWRVRVEPTQVADLFQVTLTVDLEPEDDEHGVHEAEESFYLTRPSWSEPVERDELRAVTRERLIDRQLNIPQ